MAASRVSQKSAGKGAKTGAVKAARKNATAKKAAINKSVAKKAPAKKVAVKKSAAPAKTANDRAGAMLFAPLKKGAPGVGSAKKAAARTGTVATVADSSRVALRESVAFVAPRTAARVAIATARKQAATRRAVEATPLDVAASKGFMSSLLARARQERLIQESLLSDVTVVHADESLPNDSPEVQTMNALGIGNLAALADLAGDQVEPGAQRLEIVRRLDGSTVMRANGAALRTVRRTSPGLRMFSAAYLYPQRVRALGEDLSAHVLNVAPQTPAKQFSVRLKDGAGNPVADVAVRAVLDVIIGTQVEATTDATGIANLRVPITFPRIELIMVEPEHTYWAKFLKGFDRVNAPAIVDVSLQELLPDAFHLMSSYAPFDAHAGAGVKVGIIDSGVGPHGDLTVQGGGCFVTGENSVDFLDNGIGHGTHVAGIIAAKPSAGGLYGVAPACTLMSYRVCSKTGNKGRALSVDVAAALQQAIFDQCDLVNISLGSLQAMPELPDVLDKARDAGIVVLAATGNDGRELARYPARYSHTLSVGALGRDGTFPADSPEQSNDGLARDRSEFVATFSNFGTDTDFIGVGVAVLSTFPGNLYAMMSGTSMATPFTTGMAARLLSANPQVLMLPRNAARVDKIVDLLCQHVRKPNWPDKFGGFGVLT